MTSKNPKYTAATGRRKSAITNIKIFSGKGSNIVNGRTVVQYFPQKINQIIYQKPFKTIDVEDKYHFTAKIIGGGSHSQAESLSLALSRALSKINPESFKPLLRSQGLLTVDSRVRQRRHIGTGGKARRQKQSPKR